MTVTCMHASIMAREAKTEPEMAMQAAPHASKTSLAGRVDKPSDLVRVVAGPVAPGREVKADRPLLLSVTHDLFAAKSRSQI